MKLKVLSTLILSAFFVGSYFVMQKIDNERRYVNFELEHKETKWEFQKESKKINLVYFGYTSCPDLCPMTLSHMAKASKELTKLEEQNINFIFVNVDWKIESAQQVASYVEQFNSKFLGLRGPKEAIDKATKAVGAAYLIRDDKKSALGYSVAHSDRLFLVKKNGLVLDSIPSVKSPKIIIEKIRKYL